MPGCPALPSASGVAFAAAEEIYTAEKETSVSGAAQWALREIGGEL